MLVTDRSAWPSIHFAPSRLAPASRTYVATTTLSAAASFTTSTADATITLDSLAASGNVSVVTNGVSGNAVLSNTGSLSLGASTVGGEGVKHATQDSRLEHLELPPHVGFGSSFGIGDAR